jgi:hypothetical protein
MKNQTAVQWLFDEFIKPENKGSLANLFLQAIEMEKEQIKEAYKCGACDLEIQYSPVGEINSEQYYNENYGQK